MGAILSWFFTNTGRTDDPDAVTGLTSRQKYLVQSSWEVVKKDITGNGVMVLMRLFEKHPSEIERFPFKDLPMSELPTSKKFQAHCNSVMYSLTSVVDALDDAELLVQILNKIGENHKRRRIPGQSFDQLKDVILEVFGAMPKPSYEAWEKALTVSFGVIKQSL